MNTVLSAPMAETLVTLLASIVEQSDKNLFVRGHVVTHVAF